MNRNIIDYFVKRIQFCLSRSKKVLILTTGISGVGKTNILYSVLDNFKTEQPQLISSEGYIKIDDLRCNFEQEERNFYIHCIQDLLLMMKTDEKIIAIDHLNLNKGYLDKFYILAEKYKYSIIKIRDSDIQPKWNWNSINFIRQMIIKNSSKKISERLINLQIEKRFEIN